MMTIVTGERTHALTSDHGCSLLTARNGQFEPLRIMLVTGLDARSLNDLCEPARGPEVHDFRG